MNFGAFVTPEDNILFDVNDFDETLPGVDFTVDLKRLAASVAVAASAAGINRKQARAIAAATVKAYRTHISALAKLSPLEIWHSRIDLEQAIKQIGNSDLRRQLVGVIAKARGEGLSKDDNFPHLVSGDHPKIVDKPPTIFHLDPKADARHRLGVERVFAGYRKGLNPDRQRLLDRFTMKDLAFKAVGVGIRRHILLRGIVHDRRQRAVVLAGQTSAAIGFGTARRQACLQRKPGPPGCGGPADDAGRQ